MLHDEPLELRLLCRAMAAEVAGILERPIPREPGVPNDSVRQGAAELHRRRQAIAAREALDRFFESLATAYGVGPAAVAREHLAPVIAMLDALAGGPLH